MSELQNLKIKVSADIRELTQQLDKGGISLRQFASQANGITGSIGKAGAAVNKSGKDFTGLSRVLQDLPFGFMGIQNNITQLLPAAGGLGLVISGVTAALTFAQVGLSNWTRGLSTAKDEANETRTSSERLSDALKSNSYTSAITNVAELTTNIRLAKEGFLDKASVLKQYNDTIGKTTGEVKSLMDAEKALVKNGPAYIQMSFYKAAAQEVLKDASGIVKETTRKIVEEDQKMQRVVLNAGKMGFTGQIKQIESNFAERKGAIEKGGQIELSTYEAMFTEMQTKAAAIAKKFSFDFFGGDMDEKTKPVAKIKSYSDIIKALNKDLKTTEGLKAIEQITPSEADISAVKSYESAIKSLFDLDYSPSSTQVKGLLDKMGPIQDRLDFARLQEAFKNIRVPDVEIGVPVQPVPIIDKGNVNFDFKNTEGFREGLINRLKAMGVTSITTAQGIKVPIDFPVNNTELSTAIDTNAAKITAFNSNLIETGKSLTSLFSSVFSEMIDGGGNAVKMLGRFIQQIITKLAAAAAVAAVLALLTGGIAAGGGKLKGGLGFNEIFRQIGGFKIGGNANGTDNWRGGLSWVGERGPELMNLPKGSQIIPNHELHRIGGGGGSQVVIPDVRLSGEDIYISFNKVSKRMDRSYGRG